MNALTQPNKSESLVLSGIDAFELEAQMFERVGSGRKPFEVAVWETERCLVVPKAFSHYDNFQYAAEISKFSGWPVFTRCTGGDVTPQGVGTINVSFAYTMPKGTKPCIEEQYDILCLPIAKHLQSWGVKPGFSSVEHSFCDGAFNLSVKGRKMVGTAQRWRRRTNKFGTNVIFAHALILVDADLTGGIEATNRLYENCNLPNRVREDVHLNLTSLRPCNMVGSFDTQGYMDYLCDAYERDLKKLTTKET